MSFDLRGAVYFDPHSGEWRPSRPLSQHEDALMRQLNVEAEEQRFVERVCARLAEKREERRIRRNRLARLNRLLAGINEQNRHSRRCTVRPRWKKAA